jgi:hypothetical protein
MKVGMFATFAAAAAVAALVIFGIAAAISAA